MLKIDASELREYANYLERQSNQLERYKQEYYYFLVNSPKVHLEAGLIEKIDALVYMDGKENKWYQRTGRLSDPKAIDFTYQDGKLILFMDDRWLQRHTANRLSPETGYDPQVHNGSANLSYSERVEYGYKYENEIINDYTTEPRPFMAEYFEDVVEKIKGGVASPYKIIKPIFEGWDRA